MSAGITIIAFGYISSVLGTREVTISCDSQLPLRALQSQLRNSYPAFSEFLAQLEKSEDSLLVLRNGEKLDLDSIICPSEELILATPISGG